MALAACATAPPPDAARITLVGEALTTDGPVVWARENGWVAAWIGSDKADVFQVARPLGGDAAPVVLPLPPRHPFAQQGVPAAGGRFHLLWLDANADASNRLYSALLSPDLQVIRGPVEVSDGFTQHYAVTAARDGGVRVAWSGGMPAEPSLYTQRIDADGRPLVATRVALNAAWPALATTAREPLLFWRDRTSGNLWRAAFDGSNAVRLASGVALAAADRIVNVSAAATNTFGVYVWNVTRADGSDESWLTGGSLTASDWPTPVRVALSQDDAQQPVRWLAVHAQSDRLVGAGQVGRQVGLLAFDASA